MGSSRILRCWYQYHIQGVYNGSNEVVGGEVEWRAGGYGRDVLFSLKYFVGAVP